MGFSLIVSIITITEVTINCIRRWLRIDLTAIVTIDTIATIPAT